MPSALLTRHLDELAGCVCSPPSGDLVVDTVLQGEGELLGRGNDGLVFRVFDHTVKVSTVTPYHPKNLYAYRTPEQAVTRLKEQADLYKTLKRAGVAGFLPCRTVQTQDYLFVVKPFLEVPKVLSLSVLGQVQHTLSELHRRGYALADTLQFGLRDGRPFWYDTGNLKANADWCVQDSDALSLKRLHEQNGYPFKATAYAFVLRDFRCSYNLFDVYRAQDDAVFADAFKQRLQTAFETARTALTAKKENLDQLELEYNRVLTELATSRQNSSLTAIGE